MSWTHCCGCFELRCGTLTIGALLLINHGVEVIVSIVSVVRAAEISPYHSDLSRGSFLVVIYAALAITAVWFVLDCALLRGVSSEIPGLVLAWLCWAIPMTFFTIVVACIILGLAAKNVEEEGLIVIAITLLVNYLVLAYWILVVLMHYRSMKAKARARAAARPVRGAQAPILAYGQPGMVTMSQQQR